MTPTEATESRPRTVVVDTSVALKWVLEELDSAVAATILDSWIQASARMVVPGLFWAECAAVLRKRVRRGELHPDVAVAALNTLYSVEFICHDDHLLSGAALDVANSYDLPSAYDAHYIAVAKLFDAELWTADERLYNSMRDRSPRVRLLGRDSA